MAPEPLPSTAAPRRPGVLVAAESVATRASLSARLGAGGFNVWTAADGLKAFDTFLRHTGEIDVLLLDAALPEVPAADLVRRFRANFPGIPCAYFADFRCEDCSDELRRLGAEPVAVPFAFPELLETLRGLAASDTGVPG